MCRSSFISKVILPTLLDWFRKKIPFQSESDQMTEDKFVNYKQPRNDTSILTNMKYVLCRNKKKVFQKFTFQRSFLTVTYSKQTVLVVEYSAGSFTYPIYLNRSLQKTQDSLFILPVTKRHLLVHTKTPFN